MGKNPSPKRAPRGVRKITNYELRIANLKLLFHRSLFLCVLCVFAGNSFAQNSAVSQSQIDWIAEKVGLERTIKSGNVEQKRDALFRIRNLATEEASRIAVPALNDTSEIVRATAAFSVIFLPKDEALNVLLPLLRDKKELVRREAAYALGKIRNPSAVNSLLQIFQKDKISDVKNACIVALGEIGDASAIDSLTRILQNKPKKENPADEFLRRSAARSIGQIAQIIQTNEVEVSTPENFSSDKSLEIEKPNFPRLVENFPVFRQTITVLIQNLQNLQESDDVRRETAFALGAIGDESAKSVLQSNLATEDYYLAEISKEALRKIELYSILKNSK